MKAKIEKERERERVGRDEGLKRITERKRKGKR